MNRWFRWYEGTTEDAKFRLVARLSRVTVRDVIALWAFMLEDAANLDHRGVCERNEDFMAATLDFENGIVENILEAMESAAMISVGHGAITISNWGKRQFESDIDKTSTRRKREQRARGKGRDATVTDDPVTRDTGGSDTDTDTDTEKKERGGAFAPPAEKTCRKKPKLPMPDIFVMTDRHRAYAAERGFVGAKSDQLFSAFKNHHGALGSVFANWDLAWNKWVDNEVKFNAQRPGQTTGRIPRI